ncbi:MAG: hypothetical protein J7605_26985 [Variovorax sp.]|nr:hypothetical protein [Variovorax sp.]
MTQSMAGSLVAGAGPTADESNGQKKARRQNAGREALLLSHIKAPAQGGKAGSGKPPKTEFNKGKTTYQANSDFFCAFDLQIAAAEDESDGFFLTNRSRSSAPEKR